MKFLRWLLLVPVALLAIVIAIANRQPVTFSLDPFDPLHPALGVTMPLALIVILAMFAGILIGGAASWRQARAKTAKRSSPILPPSAPATTLPVAQD
tara:strand:- start:1532 stop:1822 length:291 start_codon:yes stop_codon:yes gene_type:complete